MRPTESEETQLTVEDKKYKYIQVKPLPPLTEQIVICLVLSLSAYILQVTFETPDLTAFVHYLPCSFSRPLSQW